MIVKSLNVSLISFGLVLGIGLTLLTQWVVDDSPGAVQPLSFDDDVMRKLYDQMKPVSVEGVIHPENPPLIPTIDSWSQISWFAAGADKPGNERTRE